MEYTAIVLAACQPGRDPINFGVLVLDEGTDRIHLRFRPGLAEIAESRDEMIHGLSERIKSIEVEMGMLGVLQYLEERSSNAIRLGDRATIHADSAEEAVDRAFAEHVAPRRGGGTAS